MTWRAACLPKRRSRSMIATMRSASLGILSLLGSSTLAQDPAPLDLAACRDHVLPDADELAWRAIPWLAELRAGLAAGAEQRKPVLLWAMNGHPLGCT
jgi:hypothetical protein